MRFVTRMLLDGSIQSALSLSLSTGDRDSIPLYQVDFARLWERAISEMRALRQPILVVLDGLQSSALTLEQVSRAQVIEDAKQGLRDITKLDLSACTSYEEMRAAVGAAYYALAAALPADLRQAFSEATR